MDRYSAIRAVATSVLSDFEKRTNKAIFTAAHASHTLLDDIAFNCFTLIVADDPSLPENIIGQLDCRNGSIGVRCGLPSGRRSFTIAHELGHHALGHPATTLPDQDGDIDDSPDYTGLQVQNGVYRSYDDRSRIELEANIFAAELLAPVNLIRSIVFENPDWTVASLAQYFGVSRSAMLNQLVSALLPGPEECVDDGENTEKPTLDANQQAAVDAKAPALIIAGPGAGKTRILVDRYVSLVNSGIRPCRILALTFANKAAAEMRDRLSKALPEHAHEIAVSTFHSFGLELLKIYGENIGLRSPLKLLTPVDVFALVKKRLASMPMGVFEDLRQPARNLISLFTAISRSKDELIDPAEYLALAERWRSQLQSELESNDDAGLKARLDEAVGCVDAGHFYAKYQELLRVEGAVDYGDLIAETVRLLEMPAVGDEIRAQYDHILVDEFQDINYASGRLLKALDGGRGIIWVVGDPKQSIYRFRGASPHNLLTFHDDYPGATVISLDTNYRSVEDIVECGMAVQIPMRADGKEIAVPSLTAHRGRPSGNPAVIILNAADKEAELSALVQAISLAAQEYRRQDVAVLCRTRAQAQMVADRLEQAGLPTTWTGALHERSVFRDIMGVLYLVSGDIRGLVRLSDTAEHRIELADLQRLMDWSAHHSASALAVLYAACDGKIEELSDECVQQAKQLKRLAGNLRMQPTAFHTITGYLFENAAWFRELLQRGTPECRQTLSTLGQICNVAHAFADSAPQGDGRKALAFVEYLESCVEAGELTAPVGDTSTADAINVLTVHGSKGLQWRIVHVPFLVEGKFPNTSRHEPIPLPPGLIRGEDANDNDIEESCLFYVAVTRAQDRTILTYADKYHHTASPSDFLNQVVSRLTAKGYVDMRVINGNLPVDEPDTVKPIQTNFVFEGTIPFRALSTYELCPKMFEFQHILGLHDDDKGYLNFYAVIYSTMQQIADKVMAGEQPSNELALEALDHEWVAHGPMGHWYEERYRANAEHLVCSFASRLQPGIPMKMRQEFSLLTGNRTVLVTIDEIEEGEQIVLRWHRYGKPAKNHLDAHMPALMAAFAQQQYKGREFEVRISYPLTQHEVPVSPTQRVITSRVAKMNKLATAAETGVFAPRKSMMTCKTCHYNLICPSESDEPI